MKKLTLFIPAIFLVATLATGCSWSVGGGQHSVTMQPTVGQQLIDLQKARDSGAITEAQYQSQKTKLLQ